MSKLPKHNGKPTFFFITGKNKPIFAEPIKNGGEESYKKLDVGLKVQK